MDRIGTYCITGMVVVVVALLFTSGAETAKTPLVSGRKAALEGGHSHRITLPQSLVIAKPNGLPLVTISLTDGSVEYGPGYTPDKAARRFWEAMGYNFPPAQQRAMLKEARELRAALGGFIQALEVPPPGGFLDQLKEAVRTE